jgi:26S proteasome regulatory subunit N2
MAYQVAFDLFENDEVEFLARVADQLAGAVAPPADTAAAAAPPAAAAAAGEDAMDTAEAGAAAEAAAPPAAAPAAPPAAPVEDTTPAGVRRAKLRRILSGDAPTALSLEFLSSRNASDLNVFKSLKASVEVRNSVCHSAVVLANALAHAGTTCDTFLRDNLDWLSRATNWAKFGATAGLGVIHRGHISQGRALMAPYLPREAGGPSGGSPFSEGGALYALGLIHAGHGGPIRPFLSASLRAAASEVVQHGACLGLGLASMATAADDVFEDLKSVLYTDSAVAGEAAGLAMGMLLAGRASDKTAEMLAYAHDTAHEKIIRGLAVGLALSCYGREEEADALVETLSRDADPILRYGGAFAAGLAYRGTANNAAIRRLLHSAVSDVSDDVRRAAVLNLGFVLAGVPEQCPRVVALLAESYNPHVRYGAAMAVGIACAASGAKEALALLEPLAADSVDFVRQGAYIATALVLLQQPEARVAAFRKQLEKTVADKHEETLAKMGAILATGILDAGGRNATIALRSHSGAFRMSAFLGLALFAQHWYWYPLGALLSVALSPSALVALNGDLALPRFTVVSAAKASMFAYAPPASAVAAAPTAKTVTAVLSTTVRAKAKAAKKEAEKKAAEAEAGGAAMDTGDAKPDAAAAAAGADGAAAMDGDGAAAAGGADAAAAAAPKEEASTTLQNPARVVPAQERFIRFEDGGRYRPVKRVGAGVIILKDMTPGEPEEIVSRAPAPPPPAPAGAPAVPVVPEEEEEEDAAPPGACAAPARLVARAMPCVCRSLTRAAPLLPCVRARSAV